MVVKIDNETHIVNKVGLELEFVRMALLQNKKDIADMKYQDIIKWLKDNYKIEKR